MIKAFSVTILVLTIFACQPDEIMEPNFYSCNLPYNDSSAINPKNQNYQRLLNDIVQSGVPGIMMSINTPQHGLWLGASGKADLAGNIDMRPCNISRFGSIVKTFTAVTIMLLKEEGKLRLDDKITQYLPAEILKNIENSDKATIRQMLQHSSGIFNYIQDLKFQTASLNNLVKVWQPDELLSYARNRDAYFEPGEDVRYSNTGYILLGMIIEKVEGKPFYNVFNEKLFTPLQLNKTSFAATNPIPEGLVRGYVDFYSNLNVINSTEYSGWDYYTADGGLISTPYDITRFLESLMKGKILTSESLREMLNWETPKEPDTEFFKIHYGLGIFKIETIYGDAYLHSGDAIGYSASMVYFPAQKTTIVWAVNGNYGKIDALVSSQKAMDAIFKIVLE